MFIAKRIIFGGNTLYFEEDTKWTPEKTKAKQFLSKKDALHDSDRAGLYDITIEEVL